MCIELVEVVFRVRVPESWADSAHLRLAFVDAIEREFEVSDVESVPGGIAITVRASSIRYACEIEERMIELLGEHERYGY